MLSLDVPRAGATLNKIQILGINAWWQLKTIRKAVFYTTVDDALRICALIIYERHTEANAIDFMDHLVERFNFRIRTVRTDNGHYFQIKFHWHVDDLGMRHVYIKPKVPILNGKMERSHRTYKDEFYQLLSFTDDVDINQKVAEWEDFYNYYRPHTSLKGKTPHKVLKESYNHKIPR